MPYYRITIKLRHEKKAITGVRELEKNDIEYAQTYFKNQIFKKYSEYQVLSFDIAMISKQTDEVKKYLQKKRRPPRN